MASEVDQAVVPAGELEDEQVELEVQPNRQGILSIGQAIHNVKQLKSLEILKSAVKIFSSNTKFMLFMILSMMPLFTFMLYSEIKLQKAIQSAPIFINFSPGNDAIIILDQSVADTISLSEIKITHSPSTPQAAYADHLYKQDEFNNARKDFYLNLVQLCLLYLVIYPLLEIFSMSLTMKITAKVHAGDMQSTPKEAFYHNINPKGLSVTYLCVHLLSNVILVGLLWVVVNHYFYTRGFQESSGYYFDPVELSVYILFSALHLAMFVALLYKYLEWSSFWNMGMAISALQDETGIEALGLSDYYGKQCKPTGFQLMLVFFTLSNFLRLPCLYFGLHNVSIGGVLATAVAIGFFCLGNLVKWVAFVLYFYDCKQHTLEKKNDEEVAKVQVYFCARM